jgi:hypothetical protein
MLLRSAFARPHLANSLKLWRLEALPQSQQEAPALQ